MRLIFYRTPSFELSKKALLPHRVSRAFTMYYTMYLLRVSCCHYARLAVFGLLGFSIAA